MHCRARKRWGERSTEAITSLQSLLVISLLLWKRTRLAWEEAMCSRRRQTDRQRKGLKWLRCPESISDSQCFGSAAAPLGTGSTRVSAFRSVCQASPYPQILKHWSCQSEDVGAFKNPTASTLWDPRHEKILQEDEAFDILSGFVNASWSSLWDIVGQNGFAIKSSSKPSNFFF